MSAETTVVDLPSNPKQSYGDRKVPLGLVPPSAVVYAALGLWDGAEKYGPYNWRENAVEAMTYVHACMRHLQAWVDGERDAEDSKKPHLAHAIACLAILVDAIEHGNLVDNRPPKSNAAWLMRRFEKAVPLNPRIAQSLREIEARTPACPDLDQEYDPI